MLEEAKTHLAAVGDQPEAGQTDTCCKLAACYACAGKKDLAVVQFEDGKAAWEAAGDRAKTDNICYPLGVLFQSTGQYGCRDAAES